MPQTILDHRDESLQGRARRMTAWIEISAREASRDPDVARRKGISPVQEMSLFASSGLGVQSTYAAWLRGAVAALLPRGWRYQILEDCSGGAQLVLTGYEGEHG